MHSNNNDVHNHDQFLISKESLSELVADQLNLEPIVCALKTDLNTGILGDQTDLLSRRKHFGSNSNSPPRHKTTIKRLLSEAARDTTIILLVLCGLVSLAIGIEKNGVHQGLVDGAMAFLAICLAVTFGAVFRFVKSLNKNKVPTIKHHWVVRNGVYRIIPETEVVVGDILWLCTGDRVPADGILVNDGPSLLFSGAKVVRGQARMLVTCVGENRRKKLGFLDDVDKNNSKLEKIWLSLTLLLLIVQLARCFFGSKPGNRNNSVDPKGVKNAMEDLFNELMKRERSKANGLVTMLCILVFATRDGLPLAVFTTTLYASHKMKSTIRKKLPSATICDFSDIVVQSVDKFMVVKLTLEISGFVVNFVSACLGVADMISSFQMLWTSVVMEVVGALGVAITTIHTDDDDDEVINTSFRRSEIAVHSFFEVIVVVGMGMKGKGFFRVDEGTLGTMIFNCYAFCQVFVLLVTGIEVKSNYKRCLVFVGVVGMIGIVQVPLVEIMAVLGGWEKLDVKQWGVCVGIASFSVSLSCAANWMLKLTFALCRR